MLVSVADVRRYLGGISIPEGLTVELENVIARAQKSVETKLNRPVERVQVREVVRSDSKGYLYLSVTPVLKILSCGGTSAPLTPPTVIEPYVMTPDPSLGDDPRILDKVGSSIVDNYSMYLRSGSLYVGLHCYRNFIVEYIGGLDPDNVDDIKRVIIQMAAREWGRLHVDGAKISMAQPQSVDQQDTRGLTLSADEITALQRYRRIVAR